jgi:pimeloyl-ACP methyl ester carboxylesterase
VRRRAGSGGPDSPTALLTDGIACDGFIWKYLWDDLAPAGPVVHWNYRGHGRSGSPADPKRIELVDHAHDLDTVRRDEGDPPVVLFGHSMGCQVSLEAYRLRSAKVRGLVLICGAPGRITHTFRGTDVLAQLLPKLIARVDAHPEIVRALWGRVPTDIALRLAMMTGDVDRSIRPDDLSPYLKHMSDIDVPMFLRMLRSAGEHSASDLLPSVDVPALVIAGDRDSFTPPRYAEEMAAALPKGELLMVAGGTHAVPIERPELVKERILRFLRERVGV